jgi:lipoprotein-releasing system permease protein
LNLSYFISKKIRSGHTQGFAGAIHTIAMASIAIGLAASIVSFLIMKGFQETVKNKIYSFSGHLMVTKFSMNNSPEELPLDFNTELYNRQKDFPFIDHIQEYAHKAGLIKTEDDVLGVFIKGVGRSFDQEAFKDNLIEGEFIHFNDSSYANEIILSRTIADILKAKTGDELVVHFFQNPPRFRKLKVTGIYETNLSEYFDSKVIIGDIRMIQRLNDWGDSIAGGMEVFVHPDYYKKSALMREQVDRAVSDADLDGASFIGRTFAAIDAWWAFDFELAAMEKAREEIGDVNNYDQNIELIRDKYIQVFEWLNLLSRQVNILLGVILTVVCVNMISIVLILVMERTQMIGMLKALGSSDRLIRSIFIHNGLNLIIKGLTLGNILGLGLCFIQDRFKIVKLNARDYYMSFVPISWHWDLIIILNLLTLGIVTLVLLLPTMAISKIRPIKAIRFD